MEFSSEYNEYIAFNSYGGFNKNKDEYHILNTKTPLPWCNIMANENFGTVVSSYGTVYTYYKNSQGFKLTNWCNDWISFKPGEIFKGIYDTNYNLVYGFGYTKVLQEDNLISKKMDIFIPEKNNVKIQKITLENKCAKMQECVIEYKLEPVLGVAQETNLQYILCRNIDGILELKNPYSIDFSNCVAFVKVNCNTENTKVEYNPDEYVIKITTKIPENKQEEYAILFGCVENIEDIDKIIEQYNTIEKVDEEYENTKKYWANLVKKDFKLGDEYLEIMQNGWLLYQTIVCRLFARSAFYQSGGAIGYRDQLQDTLALINSWPEKTREQIILNSSKQFEKGDVLHWWHPHNNSGIRTYFSDDYLWLPYVLSEYINKTGDTDILDVKTSFLEDKPMGDRREVYDIYNNIDKEATVYEHAKLAINFGLSRINEENGLLEIGDGDWNDGFSSIRGESVLENAWDGTNFVRAFFENGAVLGSNSNKECKIDLISQAWAVIAMKEYPDVKNELMEALKSVDKYLVDKENMIVKLLYPAFDKPKNNPGYIKAYVPGTRENGGQYTHAATWLAKAYFELGMEKEGLEILRFINPIYHSDTKERVEKYMVEPYVVAADIYSNENHMGRGGWTWYTGSSAWMYKVIEDYLTNKKK